MARIALIGLSRVDGRLRLAYGKSHDIGKKPGRGFHLGHSVVEDGAAESSYGVIFVFQATSQHVQCYCQFCTSGPGRV